MKICDCRYSHAHTASWESNLGSVLPARAGSQTSLPQPFPLDLMVCCGSVNSPTSMAAQLTTALPCGGVEPDDVAALAIRLMTNTALTGATSHVDDRQQLL